MQDEMLRAPSCKGGEHKPFTAKTVSPSEKWTTSTKKGVKCPQKCKKNLARGVDFLCKNIPGRRKKRYFPNNKCPATPPTEMARSEILRRANVWLTERVVYSQFRSHSDPTISDGLAYRTDCAGFVAMAWDYYQSNCGFIRGCMNKGAGNWFNEIACGTLKPGDALVSKPHVMLFRKWTDERAGKFISWEEKGYSRGTTSWTNEFVSYDPASSKLELDSGIGKRYIQEYTCYRRGNVKEPDMLPPPPPTSA
eukprot:g986.t1